LIVLIALLSFCSAGTGVPHFVGLYYLVMKRTRKVSKCSFGHFLCSVTWSCKTWQVRSEFWNYYQKVDDFLRLSWIPAAGITRLIIPQSIPKLQIQLSSIDHFMCRE
jgi:hypothetical protein